RPIAADGTCRYSTGRPGCENALASAVWPTTPIRPGSRAAAAAPSASRRGNPFAARNLSTSLILAFLILCRAQRVGRTACPVAQLLREPRSLARIVAERAGLDVRRSASHSDPRRRRTAQLCFRSQPHVAVWTLIGVGPKRGLALRPDPLNSAADHHAVNVPTSGCSPVRLHIRYCWTSVEAGTGTPTERPTKILLPITLR